MMASTPFERRMRRIDRNALDLPVAGLFALAILFVAFAMPGDLLAELIGATGLPSLLPAAAPPLGFTARAAIGLAGGALGFGLIFYLLRLLDRTMLAAARPRPFAPVEEAPKPRRRDAHPDAPAPRPLSAWRELGEPAPPQRPQPVAGEREVAPPSHPKPSTPDWMADPDSESGPELVVRAPAPRPRPAPKPEPRPEARAVVKAPEPAPEPKPDPQPVAVAPVPVEASESLTELMARLETGIARRRARPAAPQVQPQVFPEAPDDRLQSAIDNLQRLAARQP
jgi:hypothetical protein